VVPAARGWGGGGSLSAHRVPAHIRLLLGPMSPDWLLIVYLYTTFPSSLDLTEEL